MNEQVTVSFHPSVYTEYLKACEEVNEAAVAFEAAQQRYEAAKKSQEEAKNRFLFNFNYAWNKKFPEIP